MIGTFIALFSLGIPGALIFILLQDKFDFWELIAGSFCLGVGFITFLLFILSVMGLPLQIWIIMTVVIICIMGLGILVWKKRKSQMGKFILPKNIFRSQFPRWSFILILILILLFSMSALLSLYWPIYAADALRIHHFKALVFHHFEGIQFGDYEINHSSYPLLTPLLHLWFMMCGATEEKIVYPIFMVALLCGLLHFFCRFKAAPPALLSAIVVASTPELWHHTYIAYANLPAVAFTTIGILYFYEWLLARGQKNLLLLSNLFCAMAAWTRVEGVIWIGLLWLFSLVPSLRRRQFWAWAKTTFIGLVLSGAWPAYFYWLKHSRVYASLDEVQINLNPEFIFRIDRLQTALQKLGEHFINFQSFGAIWILGILAIGISLLRRSWFNGIQVLVLIIGMIGLVLSTLVCDVRDNWWNQILDHGLRRLLLYLVPLISVLWASQWFSQEFPKELHQENINQTSK